MMEVRKIGPKASLEQAETAADQDQHQVRRHHLSMLSCHVGLHYYHRRHNGLLPYPPAPETEKKNNSPSSGLTLNGPAAVGLRCPRNNQIFFLSLNRNKPKLNLFRLFFGLFRETKKLMFWFVSLFRTGIETTKTNRKKL
jgi:hypothetical protein